MKPCFCLLSLLLCCVTFVSVDAGPLSRWRSPCASGRCDAQIAEQPSAAATEAKPGKSISFQEAILAAAAKSKLPAAQRAELSKHRGKHPLLWRSAENYAAHRYEAQSGKPAPRDAAGAIDWGRLVDWLAANLPALIKMLLLLLGG